MIPLARELIKNGTFVVLAANEVPALNDITAAELKVLLKDCGKIDKLLGRAVDEQVITVVSSGSALPIIDLTKVRSRNSSHVLALVKPLLIDHPFIQSSFCQWCAVVSFHLVTLCHSVIVLSVVCSSLHSLVILFSDFLCCSVVFSPFVHPLIHPSAGQVSYPRVNHIQVLRGSLHNVQICQ